MKLNIALALATTQVAANSVTTTDVECWGEIGDSPYQGECYDLWYSYCDQYQLEPESSCNVFTYSVSEIKWYSQSLSAVHWVYVEKAEDPDDPSSGSGSSDGDDFSEFGDFSKAFDFKAKLK